MRHFFHRRFGMPVEVHLIYYIHARSDRFRHADGFPFSFVLIQKKRKRKEKIKATSTGLLRNGRSGAEKWTRFVALRSDSIFQHRPAIPTLTPLRLGRSFFHAKALRCWISAFIICLCILLCWLHEILINIALKILSSRTEFSILRLSIYILNLSLYILKLSFYILSLSIELLWWREQVFLCKFPTFSHCDF